MRTALLLIQDGRTDALERTLDAAERYLPKLDELIEVDDSAHELGFGGAIAEGWGEVLYRDVDFVFHLEQDFVMLEPVPVAAMIGVLETQPGLLQVALKRGPQNADEHAAGGIVEQHPDDYRERSDGANIWTEHRRFFTTNPSVYHSRLCRQGWPEGPRSEGLFTHRLLTDPDARFAFWGGKFDPPLVDHIGVRVGHGY